MKRVYHQIVLIGASLSCAITWLIFGRSSVSNGQRVKIERPSVPSILASGGAPRVEAGARQWSAATNLSEDGWRFELFTPPAMFLDASSHRYKLSRSGLARSLAAAGSTTDRPTDAEPTDGIAPRIQLLGYAQHAAGGIAGIFQNLQTSEVRIALSGSTVDEWHLVVERVELETARIANDTGEMRLPQVRALIRDESQGCTYPLSTDETNPSLNLARRSDLSIREAVSRDG